MKRHKRLVVSEVGRAVYQKVLRHDLDTLQTRTLMSTSAERDRPLWGVIAQVLYVATQCNLSAGAIDKAKRFHAGLRAIVAIAVADRWNDEQTGWLADLVREGVGEIMDSGLQGVALMLRGDGLRRAILDHTVRLDDVKGAEVYNERRAA